jgi:hypothetical protein
MFNALTIEPQTFGVATWSPQNSGVRRQAEMVKAFIVSGEYRDRFPR